MRADLVPEPPIHRVEDPGEDAEALPLEVEDLLMWLAAERGRRMNKPHRRW